MASVRQWLVGFLIPAAFFLPTGDLSKSSGAARQMEWIQLSADGRSFVGSSSGRRFIPWGFNYDRHEPDGRLIEEYWNDDWATVEEDFGEMKGLGANIVRIHLQTGAFLHSPEQIRDDSIHQLRRLVFLAERMGLYLILTGLGCYRKTETPDWYDQLDEEGRWAVQARFWAGIAQVGASSPAVFCYDLMNEPVVPGAEPVKEWVGTGFAGLHYTQFVTRDLKGRERSEVARQWIRHLVAAIRKHDRRHLITVGLVSWSLDRPGLTSGFVPEKIGSELDFLSVHLYPESGRTGEALEILKGFARVGKPVVIEEIFPLYCSPQELSQFIEASKDVADGWIGFYWGKTKEECQKGTTFQDMLMVSWLELFRTLKTRVVR